ncbi:MAG: threonine/serine exporter family protein [Butyricicoccus sp.]|nr:threonine/serine exporter family protein [Butyricicoccus sp.]
MGQITFECVMSFFASLCFGVIFQVRGIKLIFSGLGGALGWLVYLLCAVPFPGSTIPRFFIATVVITLFTEWCARLLRAPVSVFLAVALIPLVPGGGIYQTMLYCVQGNSAAALTECIRTIGIAGAMSMGVVIVSSVVHMVLNRHSQVK